MGALMVWISLLIFDLEPIIPKLWMSCEIEFIAELPFLPSSLLISSEAPRVYVGVVRIMCKVAAPNATITHKTISFQCDRMMWKKSSKLKTSSTSTFCVVGICGSFVIMYYKLCYNCEYLWQKYIYFFIWKIICKGITEYFQKKLGFIA